MARRFLDLLDPDHDAFLFAAGDDNGKRAKEALKAGKSQWIDRNCGPSTGRRCEPGYPAGRVPSLNEKPGFEVQDGRCSAEGRVTPLSLRGKIRPNGSARPRSSNSPPRRCRRRCSALAPVVGLGQRARVGLAWLFGRTPVASTQERDQDKGDDHYPLHGASPILGPSEADNPGTAAAAALTGSPYPGPACRRDSSTRRSLGLGPCGRIATECVNLWALLCGLIN